ncbi:MAG TPA: MFS transporter, partial [Ignavibacteria bacterium]
SISVITGELGKSKSVMGISMHSIIRRIPMIIGPLVGGILIDSYGLNNGMIIIFIIAAAISASGIFLARNFKIKDEKQAGTKYSALELWRKSDKRFKNLLVSDILVRFCEQIPYVFVVLWCLDIVKTSAGQFGILTAIEMVTASLCYIPVAHFSDQMEKKPFVLITFVFFTLFPLMLYFSSSFGLLAAAFVIRGLKEFGEPTRKAMIMELALDDAKARAFGYYYFLRDGIVAFAGFAGGLLWSVNPSLNLFIAAAFGVIGTVYFWIFGKGTEQAIKN